MDSSPFLGQKLASGEGLIQEILTIGRLGEDLDNKFFELDTSNEQLATDGRSNRDRRLVSRYKVPVSKPWIDDGGGVNE